MDPSASAPQTSDAAAKIIEGVEDAIELVEAKPEKRKFTPYRVAGTSLLGVKLEGGGRLPLMLSGRWTKGAYVEKAIARYLELRGDGLSDQDIEKLPKGQTVV